MRRDGGSETTGGWPALVQWEPSRQGGSLVGASAGGATNPAPLHRRAHERRAPGPGAPPCLGRRHREERKWSKIHEVFLNLSNDINVKNAFLDLIWNKRTFLLIPTLLL